MTASNQPSESDIGTLFALYREWDAGVSKRLTSMTLYADDSGHIHYIIGNDSVFEFDTHAEAISKLRAAIEAAAPKPAEVSEPDGYHYIQRGNPRTGEWEFIPGHKRQKWVAEWVAKMQLKFESNRNPGISFRLADSNGKPLSIPLTVSSELDTEELGKLRPMNIDRIYEGE